jgi:antitoxin ParD1/3/4
MSMTRKTITVTDQMDKWIKAQIRCGRYGNDSEYVRDLIRRDQERLAELKLGEMIDAADAEGLSELTASEVWEEAMSNAKEQKAKEQVG